MYSAISFTLQSSLTPPWSCDASTRLASSRRVCPMQQGGVDVFFVLCPSSRFHAASKTCPHNSRLLHLFLPLSCLSCTEMGGSGQLSCCCDFVQNFFTSGPGLACLSYCTSCMKLHHADHARVVSGWQPPKPTNPEPNGNTSYVEKSKSAHTKRAAEKR